MGGDPGSTSRGTEKVMGHRRGSANSEQVTTEHTWEKRGDHAFESSHRGMGKLGYLPNNCHPTGWRGLGQRDASFRWETQVNAEVGKRGWGTDQELQQKAPRLCWHTVRAQAIHVSGPSHKAVICSHSDFCSHVDLFTF